LIFPFKMNGLLSNTNGNGESKPYLVTHDIKYLLLSVNLFCPEVIAWSRHLINVKLEGYL